MRLLTLIVAMLLAVSAEAQELTYQQLGTVMSAKEIPNKRPQSYLAANGLTYCVGGEIEIIQNDRYVNLVNSRKEYGPATIVDMMAIGNKKRGFSVFANVKTASNRTVYILNLDEALAMNEVRGGADSVPLTEINSASIADANEVVPQQTYDNALMVNDATISYDTLASFDNGYYSSYMTIDNKVVTVNQSTAVIGVSLFKQYLYVECPTKYEGQSGVVTSIAVEGRGSRKTITMKIALDNGRVVFVNDVNGALMEGEIYFR